MARYFPWHAMRRAALHLLLPLFALDIGAGLTVAAAAGEGSPRGWRGAAGGEAALLSHQPDEYITSPRGWAAALGNDHFPSDDVGGCGRSDGVVLRRADKAPTLAASADLLGLEVPTEPDATADGGPEGAPASGGQCHSSEVIKSCDKVEAKPCWRLWHVSVLLLAVVPASLGAGYRLPRPCQACGQRRLRPLVNTACGPEASDGMIDHADIVPAILLPKEVNEDQSRHEKSPDGTVEQPAVAESQALDTSEPAEDVARPRLEEENTGASRQAESLEPDADRLGPHTPGPRPSAETSSDHMDTNEPIHPSSVTIEEVGDSQEDSSPQASEATALPSNFPLEAQPIQRPGPNGLLAMVVDSQQLFGDIYSSLVASAQEGRLSDSQKLGFLDLSVKIPELQVRLQQLSISEQQAQHQAAANEQMGISNQLSKERLEQAMAAARRREALKASADSFMAGFIVHFALLIIGVLRIGTLQAVYMQCMARPYGFEAGGRSFAALAALLVVSCCLLTGKTLQAAPNNPLAIMAVCIGMGCGWIGKSIVDTAGGQGTSWLCCWFVWIAFQVGDTLAPLWLHRVAKHHGHYLPTQAIRLCYPLMKLLGLPLVAFTVGFSIRWPVPAWYSGWLLSMTP